MTSIRGSVLVVDDDPSMLATLSLLLKSEEHEVAEASSAEEAIKRLRKESFDLVITDMRMEKQDSGIEVLKQVKHFAPETEVIVVTAYGSIETAIEATRLGAYDYITTPCENDEIILKVSRALERRAISSELQALQHLHREQADRFNYDSIIAVSKPMRRVVELLKKVAPTEARVLLLGESGTGKDLLAKTIHYNGPRARKSFVALNCAAIPEGLLESELFGIESGTATGVTRKQGKFLQANHGTIFLDEIGDMAHSTQAKVLRVLQEEELVSVGAEQPMKIDVRVISATNQDLKRKIDAGTFREDLLFRLNVFTINIPPLRDRREDILPLALSNLRRPAIARTKGIDGFTKAAQEALLRYAWPGNVRELENVVERAAIVCTGDLIEEQDLVLDVPVLSEGKSAERRPVALKEAERDHIIEVLKLADGNKARAARLLDISRSTLWAKMREYGIEGDDS